MTTLTSPARGSIDSSVFPMTYTAAGGGSGPVTAATLRNIATRTRPAGSITVADLFCMSRTMHHNRGSSVQFVQLVFSHWYANFNGEFTPGSPLTLTAAIEFPYRSPTQVTWGGASSVVIQPGTSVVSDLCWVAIPAGGRFWVRNYQNCASGTLGLITASLDRTAQPTISGEAGIYTVGAGTDLTMSTTTDAAGGVNLAYYPSAILGMSSVPSVLVLGDSRCAGLQDNPALDIGLSGAGEICRSLTGYLPYTNCGFPTDQAQTFVSTQATTGYRKSLGAYHTHVHSQYGINDFTFNQSLAQMQASQAAIQAMFPGKPFSLSTLPPVTTSTDSWATVVNQTVTAGGVVATQRPLYNAWVLTKPLSVQNIWDVNGFCEEPTAPGKWKAPDISTWTNKAGVTAALPSAATGDGTHETPFMYGAIENSNTINPALIV